MISLIIGSVMSSYVCKKTEESHKDFMESQSCFPLQVHALNPVFLGGLLELLMSLSLPPKKLGFTAAGFSLQSGLWVAESIKF
jgi:hypothetical protein